MSLIGPRPVREEVYEENRENIPFGNAVTGFDLAGPDGSRLMILTVFLKSA